MDNRSFGEGFLFGTMIASVVLVFFATLGRDQGRDECDKKLPRNQKCVQVWVPETPKEQPHDN